MVTGRSNMVEVNVIRKHELDKGWWCDAGLVDLKGAPKDVFLPRSQIECHPRPDGTTDVVMPEWLAKDKGLI